MQETATKNIINLQYQSGWFTGGICKPMAKLSPFCHLPKPETYLLLSQELLHIFGFPNLITLFGELITWNPAAMIVGKTFLQLSAPAIQERTKRKENSAELPTDNPALNK